MEIRGGNRAEDITLRTPGLETRLISRPLGECGGDMHFVSVCRGGLLTRILLADVCGHGPGVSGFANELHALARRYINTESQSSLVCHLNERLRRWSSTGRFATALVGSYVASKRQLILSNAGHPRPLLFRARTGEWDLLDAPITTPGHPVNLPLGILRGIQYRSTTLEFEIGDVVIFYTDLLTDTRDQFGDPLCEQGVLDAVRRLHEQDPHGLIAERLLDEIQAHASPSSPKDDVTVLEFRQVD